MMKRFLLLFLVLLLPAAAFAENGDGIRVSYLGPEGTYTEEAAQFWFQDGGDFIPENSVNNAIEAVLTGDADFAVIPQENTLGGAVVNYVDALIKADGAYVAGEIILPISQTLMGVPGAKLEDIRTVCSHAQGLTQSAQWRAENLPDADAEEMASTAAAASYVAEQQDRSIAAVAAPGAAELYGLEVLAKNVQITDSNKTRFYVLSGDIQEDESLTRALFVAECDGSEIKNIIDGLYDAGLDLVSLHDRPEGSRLGSYYYVIEAEDETGISDDQIIAVSALDGVRFAGRFNSAEKMPEENTESIPGWTADSPAMASIIAFVESVTDESSPDYVPPEKRIVLFDSDGTLFGERYPTYSDQCMLMYRLLHDDSNLVINEEDAAFAKALEKAIRNREPLPASPRPTAQMAAESFAGFTVEEYQAYVRAFLEQEVPGFEGMTYGQRYFTPMVELVKYLAEHDFRVYINSGTERMFLREMIADTLGEWIPPYQVIGSIFSLTATGQGDTAPRSYTYTSDDDTLLEGNLSIKNLKMNKVVSTINEIGMAPILVFGNSDGDFGMAQYALQHGGRAYMLLCDDTERDYGNPEVAASFKEQCEEKGFYTISMKDEFAAIYQDGVQMREEQEPAGKEPALLSEYWTEGSAAAASLNDYILAVTDEASPDYIPVEDRIAVFDLDGTLMCETYPFCFEYMVFADYALNSGSDTVTDEVKAVAQEIMDAAGKAKPDGMSTRQAAAGAVAYRGMTMPELAGIVAEFKGSKAWGFSGMTRGEAYYKPMVELFDKLLENDFTVYIVTATERNIVREVIKGTLAIPPSHVIGTEYGYTATGQGDTAVTDYTFQTTDKVVFDGNYYGENAKNSKVVAITREIGQQPVLAFGNSSGDLAMEIYTISDNPYRSAAYMVVADDAEREYGDPEGAVKKKTSYEDMGIGVISMRDDFKTIYGDGVVKIDENAGSGSTEEVHDYYSNTITLSMTK